jgi:hypothetical protein
MISAHAEEKWNPEYSMKNEAPSLPETSAWTKKTHMIHRSNPRPEITAAEVKTHMGASVEPPGSSMY